MTGGVQRSDSEALVIMYSEKRSSVVEILPSHGGVLGPGENSSKGCKRMTDMSLGGGGYRLGEH